MRLKQRAKIGHTARILRPHLVVQMDGGKWTTSKKDPGGTCPKCGDDLIWSDDTLFCEGGFGKCNFQYTFTEEEIAADMARVYAEEDKKAIVRTQELVAAQGPPVFGQAHPDTYTLPSELYNRDDENCIKITITLVEDGSTKVDYGGWNPQNRIHSV